MTRAALIAAIAAALRTLPSTDHRLRTILAAMPIAGRPLSDLAMLARSIACNPRNRT